MEAPAFSTVEISSASRVKSAERIDGAISIMANTQGVGVRTGGRRFTLVLERFVGALVFACVGVTFEFAFPFSARLVLRFAARFTFPFPFSLALAFLFAGFRLFALPFELFAAALFSWPAGEL